MYHGFVNICCVSLIITFIIAKCYILLETSEFSTEGCTTVNNGEEGILNCECDHLSFFCAVVSYISIKTIDGQMEG